MRNLCSMLATLSLATLTTSCALDTPDTPTTGTAAQELNKLRACFTDLGQPDPAVPLSRRFDSSCSTPTPGSYIALRTWDFGDGTLLTTGGTVTDHTFPFTNTCYKVSLDVFDANGKDDRVSQNIVFCSVGPCAPVCPP
jgi:PKD domain